MTKKVKDPGLGYRTSKNAKKLINHDGTSNVIHHNRTSGMYDLYSYLIEVSWRKFFLFVIATYILANIFFAIVYYLNWDRTNYSNNRKYTERSIKWILF